MKRAFLKGVSVMMPFALSLLFIVGGAFVFLFLRERFLHEQFLYKQARDIAYSVLAVRNVFAENQDRINSSPNGNTEFKHLNPAAGANAYIAKTGGFTATEVKQTSLLYRRQENAPDDWEKKVLSRFGSERNLTEYSEINRGKERVFRYALPLYIDSSCLKCHGEPKGELDITGYPKEGYKVGDLRGAITVSIPMKDFYMGRNEQFILFFSLMAAIIGIVFWTGRRMVVVLSKVANTDRLTQINNRNVLYERLSRDLVQAARYRMPLAVLMFDIDHFKQVNDRYGHLAGDEVLKSVANIARSLLRKGDTLARYGGEEFAIVAPNTDETGALTLGERLRTAVAEKTVFFKDQEIRVTISVGVVSQLVAGEESNEKQDEFLNLADHALYQAKNSGRNRVEVYKKE